MIRNIINIFLLTIFAAVIAFIVVLAFSINTWLSYIVCSIIVIGLVVFPFRLGIIETIRDYKDYRKNRPVKILNSVNKSLSTDKK
jgi:hypothetical protein